MLDILALYPRQYSSSGTRELTEQIIAIGLTIGYGNAVKCAEDYSLEDNWHTDGQYYLDDAYVNG